VCNDFSLLPQAFWDTYNGKSEPYGLINLKLSRETGRLGEPQYPDPDVMGFNPCAEQSLNNYETCCLAEVFLPNIESKEEFLDVATLLYRVNKHSLSLPCHHKETEKIVHRNMRMGIGITGILQCPEKLEWCDYVYKELRKYDEEYSKQHGFRPSIKLGTCKPSGTLSLLPGVTSGVHPAFAQYMIRRIRIAADHALVETCKNHGYPVEYQKNFDGTLDYNTVVVEFPFAYPEGTILAEEMSAIDQLEWVKKVQTVWSDNAVSCTVYYTPEELPIIREYLSTNYNQCFKSLSFLLRNDHGFIQAPLEAIDKDEYDRRVAASRLIVDFDDAANLGVDLNDCSTGVCPIR
jgi:ribonucleotide reductase alpha subunit